MTTTFANPGTITMLQERVAAGVGRVDRENGVIHGVRILGRVSKNNREYSPEAIRGAAKLYEGIRVNVDHPSGAKSDRSLTSRCGWLSNVRASDSGLTGDLHLILSHPMSPAILEMAERNPSLLGLSHNAEGRITKRDGRNIVEEITHVRSVDLVADPATADSLFESRRWSIDMSSKEFAERLFEADGEGFAPASDPVDRIPAADDNADADAELRKLQRELLDMIQAAVSVDGLLRDLQRLVNDKGLPVLDPSELSPAAESYLPTDAAEFASVILEGGGSSPSQAKRFADRLFD